MSRTRTTLWNLGHLYFGTVLSFVRGIVLVPLYLLFIPSDLYGAWLASGNILMWMTLIDPGVGDVATQKVASAFAKNDKENIGLQIGSSLIISFFILIVVVSVGSMLSHPLLSLIKANALDDYSHLHFAFIISVISSAITLSSISLSGSILGLQRTKELGFITNGARASSIVLNVVMLSLGYKLLSIAYSNLLSSFIMIFGFSFLLFKVNRKEQIRVKFNWLYFKNYSKIFSFTFLDKMAGTFASHIDLVVISRFIDLDTVTMYELTRRPLKFLKGIVTTPSIALLPSMAHLSGEADKAKLKRTLLKSGDLFIFLILLITTGFITFNSYFVQLWVGSEYYLGFNLNILLALFFLSSTFAYIFSNFCYSLGKIKEVSVFDFIKNIIYIIVLIVSAYLKGVGGILVSTLILSVFTEFWYYPKLIATELNITGKDIKVLFYKLLALVISFLVVGFIFHRLPITSTLTFGIFCLMYLLITTFIYLLIFRDSLSFIRIQLKKRRSS